jgi:hypothetical protein
VTNKKSSDVVRAALITAGATVVVALVAMMSPAFQNWWNNRSKPEPPPPHTQGVPPEAPKKNIYQCKNDPASGDPYFHDVTPFAPQDHMSRRADGSMVPLGGDAPNPGHEWAVEWQSPGTVYRVECSHKGTSEEITFCAPKEDDHTAGRIVGWINGQGGTTYMRVLYEMPCDHLPGT